MEQHFLLSAAARTLSLKSIYAQGEEAAYARFCRLRWPETNGKPVCPQCGYDDAYSIKTRRKFKCKACHHQFSVTSGTMFASHKLAFIDLLGAIALVANAAKGISALQLARTVCRRAERRMVALAVLEVEFLAYMNRLSDLLFVLARVVNRRAGVPEAEW